ncbi:UNVERIFIED_CONTAM: hypothetical protein Scaly_2906600 [Sesamum calycinum]|uniref:Reverse transcriptase n=1 Tax=Sesamum calycinum TaxID=2727403 RepID=A0AAW2L363_9LAMI
MYEVVCKLKALKADFRRQRQWKGNLTENVKMAKRFLDKAQTLFATYKEDLLLHLVKCCRTVYSESEFHDNSKWTFRKPTTRTFSALNGSVHGFFKGSRGLRQGRPSIYTVLRDTLTEFAALSGLNVNPAKSQIILSRAVQQERRQIVEYLGFQEGSLPVRYLGVPLTSSRLTIADCRPLINRIDTRLAGWNQHNLSYAGVFNSSSQF